MLVYDPPTIKINVSKKKKKTTEDLTNSEMGCAFQESFLRIYGQFKDIFEKEWAPKFKASAGIL